MTATPEQRLAAELNRRGLAAPARLLVAAHLPLAPLFADAAAAVGPLLSVVSIGSRAGPALPWSGTPTGWGGWSLHSTTSRSPMPDR